MTARSIFEALPGLEVPMAEIGRGLSQMWARTAEKGRPAPASEDATATQVNFVLHLGLGTTAADAVRQFDTAVRFSRRHPSRVVVLCPEPNGHAPGSVRTKVYGECTLGKSKDDTRCCEFVLLGYPAGLSRHLEDQVSICLCSDLPLYYWAHAFSDTSRLADYRDLLGRSKRIILDSANAPEDAFSYPWPRPEAVRDLAYARLLPVRQSIGQFLSRYPMGSLCSGLRTVVVSQPRSHAAEAHALLQWLRERLGQCGGLRADFSLRPAGESSPGVLAVNFGYAGRKGFSWRGDLRKGSALFRADLGTRRTVLPAAVSLLPPENALSEAVFF